jgi:hypothetical protein
MQQRVSCVRCGAHRDLAIARRCLVCGAEGFDRVLPTAGDVDAITHEVLAAAEGLDQALNAGAVVSREHHDARRLHQAFRDLALARAGRRAARV